MERILKAAANSWRAFRHLAGSEAAFRQELVLLAVAVPVAWLISTSLWVFTVLVASVLAIILVEVINTGIEAACDAVSREFNIDIQLAKDCGSLAVAIAILIAAGVWAVALADRFD